VGNWCELGWLLSGLTRAWALYIKAANALPASAIYVAQPPANTGEWVCVRIGGAKETERFGSAFQHGDDVEINAIGGVLNCILFRPIRS
jgi:hypothetical protein